MKEIPMPSDHDLFVNQINKKIPNEKDKAFMIMTLAGISGMLAECIVQTMNINALPVQVQYALTLAAANIISLTQDSEGPIPCMDLTNETKENYAMGEQTQERIYRTMKKIVMKLYAEVTNDEQAHSTGK